MPSSYYSIDMEFRRASVDDYPAILRLQAANFVDNIAPEERGGGFLSAEFTLPQIDRMARDVGIIVAEDQGAVVACLCSFSPQLDHRSPVITELLRRFDEVQYGDRPLRDQRPFVYGPVVIDRTRRGRGILRGLYQRLLQEVAGRFEVGVAFVAESNPHSMRVHLVGLGMTPVGKFEWDGNGYRILAFTVPSN